MVDITKGTDVESGLGEERTSMERETSVTTFTQASFLKKKSSKK